MDTPHSRYKSRDQKHGVDGDICEDDWRAEHTHRLEHH